jgi:hypothetical protein
MLQVEVIVEMVEAKFALVLRRRVCMPKSTVMKILNQEQGSDCS